MAEIKMNLSVVAPDLTNVFDRARAAVMEEFADLGEGFALGVMAALSTESNFVHFDCEDGAMHVSVCNNWQERCAAIRKLVDGHSTQ